MLKRPEVRLLTVTGAPGVGKTRLSLAFATELNEQFAGGVTFIPLASISNANLVIPAIAQALGIRASVSPLIDSLANVLQPQRRLPLLDNFEQVSAAAPLLVRLLERAPHLKILVTSRAALRVLGEYEFVLRPLPLPDLTAANGASPWQVLPEYPSVALFVQRAQAVNRDFSLTESNAAAVAAICVRLDGLPLAIELAARSKILPPQALLERLDQSLTLLSSRGSGPDARHQTLQQAIAWSYELLAAEEQALFRRLGVFTGEFSLKAAETVCAIDEIEPFSVVELLGQLVDKSLVVAEVHDGEPRYRLLATLRQFALDRLAASDELAAMRQRHCDFFLQLAETADARIHSDEQIQWLERLALEYDNLRAAMDWTPLHPPEPGGSKAGAIGLRLAGALIFFWALRGDWNEGRGWLERALEQAQAATPARARALQGVGVLAMLSGDHATALSQFLIKSITGRADLLVIPRPLIGFAGSLDGVVLLTQIIYWRCFIPIQSTSTAAWVPSRSYSSPAWCCKWRML